MKINSGGYRAQCPSCATPMTVYNSEQITPVYKAVYGRCTNILCATTLVGSLTWDYTLSPSGLQEPLAQLPMAPSVLRQQIQRDNAPDTDQIDMFDDLTEQVGEASCAQ